ncbi:unnamed protein product [Arctia plantaginis]|uniref:FHA domain-containing protein n=1 Tax=Arctia plantaginis TaxID=874455 RepID=A0A8S0YVC1_ARCPL|nr:unnamed protein product [Arctia plantaginis]
MSGGHLVVLDRMGRDVKRFPLAEGVVTLGSDHSCDIRFMLDSVDPHHATVAVHANQTVVRNVCGGSTLVNGRPVSVAALRHGDVITIGGRELRWDYTRPDARRIQAPQPALYVSRRKPRSARRGSGPAPAARRDPALQVALEMTHRASMPANVGGKQVAIVQPQRRDTNEEIAVASPRGPRARSRAAPVAPPWGESRAAPPQLRTVVLRRAHGARRPPVTKIQAPTAIDHTKQAAILLMTGHTPKSKFLGQKTPSPNLTSTAPSVTPTASRKSADSRTTTPKAASPKATTSKAASPKVVARRSVSFVVKKKSPVRRSTRAPLNHTVTVLDTTDRNSTHRYSSRRSGHRSFEKSPLLPSPKKSALKNPLAKKSMRKTESIKFDLSNLEGHSQESDVLTVSDTSRRSEGESTSEDELTLHYSETSSTHSPSPRRSIHSRSGRILEKTLGTTMTISPPSKTLASESLRSRTSLRGSAIVQRALNKSGSPRSPKNDLESYSIVDLVSADSTASGRSTSMYDSATSATLGSGSPTGTLGDRSSRKTKSIIDSTLLGSSTPYAKVTKSSSSRLHTSARVSTRLSDDSNRSAGTGSGFYDSTRESSKSRLSNNRSRLLNGEPRQSSARSRLSNDRSRVSSKGSKFTRLSSDSSRLSNDGTRLSSNSSKLLNDETRYSSVLSNKTSSRKSKSFTTPENASIPISLNSTRISRATRSRSRINDSDLFLVEAEESGDSPKSSKRISTKTLSSAFLSTSASVNATPSACRRLGEGISTPENSQSPEEATTPVLSIQSLLESSHGSILPQSAKKRGRSSLRRNTFAVLTGPKTRISTKSKSMNFSPRNAPSRLSNDSYENMNISEQQVGEVVTPKSAVKLVQEAVKNKHSTAKKPLSKRSIIDDLNESDIVKQLFNSPVKRKLSQSMTEFSRKQLFDDDDIAQARRPTRNTVVLGMLGRSPDDSLLDRTETFTPEQFVSPMSTPSHSPNLAGIKRLFGKSTPENDLRDIRGVKALLRTPRARKPIRDDLTDVAGLKAVFARSPRNRLSDVRVKEVFVASPDNDLRRVSGVKSLFRSQKKRKSHRNTLSDVRGVKKLFNKSPEDDLRNVAGVKRIFQLSPKNDLSDVRGVKRLFRRDKFRNELSDMSGVEELFNESDRSHRDAESLFDRLVGKPTVKAVYSKSFQSRPKPTRKNSPKSKSLLDITLNPEKWLEGKLKTLLQNRSEKARKEAASASEAANRSKPNVTRDSQSSATPQGESGFPLRPSKMRHGSAARASREDASKQRSATELYSARKLPIKKRSLVDASSELAKNESEPLNLPIKKRAVVHSTPVKGRQLNLTLGAADLGRVSPIVMDPAPLDRYSPRYTMQDRTTEVRPKSRRGTRAKPSATSPAVKNPSPKKTRAKSRVHTPTKTQPASISTKNKSPTEPKTQNPPQKLVSSTTKKASLKPVSPKSTRSRRLAPVSPKVVSNIKKRGAKLVVSKKSPVMSPRPRASRKRKDPDSPTPKVSPKRNRGTRNKDEKVAEKTKTPKIRTAKVQKLSFVVSKSSPQLKPRATRGKVNRSEAEPPKEEPKAKLRVTRKADVKSRKIESPKKSPVKSKSQKEVVVEMLPNTRGKRKTTVENNKSKRSVTEVEKAQPQTRRGRAAVAEEAIVSKKARKTVKHESPIKKQEIPAAETKVTRGKKLVQQESVQSEPTTSRSRRGAKPDTSGTEVNTRKRKTVAPDDRPAKLSKKTESEEGRGRRKKIESPKKKMLKSVTKASKTSKQVAVDVAKKSTRSRKVEVSVEVSAQKPTRGKKKAVAEVVPEVVKRKRKTAIESAPVEEVRKKSRPGRKADPPPPPQAAEARRRRRR